MKPSLQIRTANLLSSPEQEPLKASWTVLHSSTPVTLTGGGSVASGPARSGPNETPMIHEVPINPAVSIRPPSYVIRWRSCSDCPSIIETHNLSLRQRSLPVPFPLPLDFNALIWNQFRTGSRITFHEVDAFGLGMLDLLLQKDRLVDKPLPMRPGDSCKGIFLALKYVNRTVPPSSSWRLNIPLQAKRYDFDVGDPYKLITRRQLAMRVAYLHWQHQHILGLPAFKHLRLISLHTMDYRIWHAEILVVQ